MSAQSRNVQAENDLVRLACLWWRMHGVDDFGKLAIADQVAIAGDIGITPKRLTATKSGEASAES